jgi:hypothetical protein
MLSDTSCNRFKRVYKGDDTREEEMPRGGRRVA